MIAELLSDKQKENILQLYNDKSYTIFLTFKEIIKIQKELKRPEFQTDLNNDKINELVKSYLRYPHIFLAKNLVTIANIDKEYFLFDGQHRCAMAEILYKEHKKNDKFIVSIQNITTADECHILYKELNMDSTKNEKYVMLNILEKKRQLEFKKLLEEKYMNCYTKNQSSKIEIYAVEEFINLLRENNFFVTHESCTLNEMFEIIDEKHNQFFNELNYLENEKNETMFYKSEIKRIQLKNIMFFKKNNYIKYLCNGEKPKHNYKNNRDNYTKEQRNKVWENEFKTSKTGNCYFCSKIMKKTNLWIMAHVKSLKNGGSNDLKNIRPLCADCNINMGSKNWNEYEKIYEWEKKYEESDELKCSVKKCKNIINKYNYCKKKDKFVCDNCIKD
jgi:hypothetical protein